MRVLVLDIGGNHVKLYTSDRSEPAKVDSGPTLTPDRLVKAVKAASRSWEYEVLSIGFPGPIVEGHPLREPRNLGQGWVGFDFAEAFGRPVRVINDAAMQALGCYRGGRMLFLGLGTGLGSALVLEGVLQPTELGELPYKRGKSFEEYVGAAGRKQAGDAKWRRRVFDVVARLKDALQVEYVVLGGGDARRLPSLPPGSFLGDNRDAREGGLRLWSASPGGQAGDGASGDEPPHPVLR